MRKYIISTNSKTNKINKVDNTIITSNTRNTPLSVLRKLLPNSVVQRSNSGNWNIMLWQQDTDTHLYYIAK